MPDLVEMIKQIAAGVYDAKAPMEICYGTVQSLSPFKIRMDQKKVLGKEYFVVRYGTTTQSFEVGDELILIRMQGGQQWLIFDRKGAL